MDTITYIAAVNACEKGGHWDQAVRSMLGMAAAHAEMSTTQDNAAADSDCEKDGQWCQVVKLSVEMETGPKPELGPEPVPEPEPNPD